MAMREKVSMTDEKQSTLMTGTMMKGKRGIIMGVANEKSIAWGIAQAVHAHGAELCFTYQGEALEKRIRPLAESIGVKTLTPADVIVAAEDARFQFAFRHIGLAPDGGLPEPQDALAAGAGVSGVSGGVLRELAVLKRRAGGKGSSRRAHPAGLYWSLPSSISMRPIRYSRGTIESISMYSSRAW